MAYDINKKINSIFSDEFVLDRSTLLSPKSPKRSSKKKNKSHKYGSNIVTKLEDSLNKNKEEMSITKSKKRKSSKLKKKDVKLIHSPSREQVLHEPSNKTNKKKLRQMKTTATIILKNIKENLEGDKKEKYKENEKDYEHNDIDNDMFLKKKVNSNNNNCLKRKISKEIKKSKEKEKEKEKEEIKDNKKEKKKKLHKVDSIKKEKDRYNNNLIDRKKDENDKDNDLYLSISEDSISSKSNKSNKINNNQKLKKPKEKKIWNKKSQKLDRFIFKENKNIIRLKTAKEEKINNNGNNNEIKKDNKILDEIIISKENNKKNNDNIQNTLISYNSEKDSDNNYEMKIKNDINSKSTRFIKNRNSNELSSKKDNNSIIKVKRVNNKKRLGDISSQFQITQRVSNFNIYSQRDNQNNIFYNKNIISPGNIISFEYNLSQRKQNNTNRNNETKNIEENNNREINNDKLNNIICEDESSIKKEIKSDNNKYNNEFIYHSNKDKKIKKNKCLCCL